MATDPVQLLIDGQRDLTREVNSQNSRLCEQSVALENLSGQIKVLNERLSEYPDLKRKVHNLETRMATLAAGIALGSTLAIHLIKTGWDKLFGS